MIVGGEFDSRIPAVDKHRRARLADARRITMTADASGENGINRPSRCDLAKCIKYIFVSVVIVVIDLADVLASCNVIRFPTCRISKIFGMLRNGALKYDPALIFPETVENGLFLGSSFAINNDDVFPRVVLLPVDRVAQTFECRSAECGS